MTSPRYLRLIFHGRLLEATVDENADAPKHVKQESLDIRDLLALNKDVSFPSESHKAEVSFMKERPPSDLVCLPFRCLE